LEGDAVLKKKKPVIHILVMIAILLVVQVFFVPVSFDAGACSGGFTTHISEKHAYTLGVMFIHKNNYNKLRSYNYHYYIPSINELTKNMSWKER
jgi:hypothetical protein